MAKRTALNDLDTYIDALAGSSGVKSLRKAVDSGESESKTFLLLTCIDLRYPAVIFRKLEPKFHKLYDHVCLAGAGLAPVIDFGADRKPHWQQTFLEHVAISVALHSITRVVVMDHRDCGAYRKFGLLTKADNGSAKEDRVHQQQCRRLSTLLQKEFPDLSLDYMLLDIEPEHEEANEKVAAKIPITLFRT